MANIAVADKNPTFNLPTGGSSDFYLVEEINDTDSRNNGKVIKKRKRTRYPFLTRRTGQSLVGTNEEITSSELRHGRTESKTRLGNASSSGGHDIEFSPETFDDELRSAFRSDWVRWNYDGQPDLITKDYRTSKGYIHVNGDDGTYNQEYLDTDLGKGVSSVPLFYTGDEAGTHNDPYGIIKVSADKLNNRANNPLGKFVVHEIHCENNPVKFSFINRMPINKNIVRYQDYKHVEVGEFNLSVTVNSIVTGSFTLSGSDNPSYFTEIQEKGKIRMADQMAEDKAVALGDGDEYYAKYDDTTALTLKAAYEDAAERFLAAVKSTVKSTETDQFTALEGFLYINGHQIQYASDLSLDINNNLTPVNAIYVKNAIANISPRLNVTGSITAYFTDGEMDSTGKKFGADDLQNLAAQNKDVEILFSFLDKENPDVIYLFQVFKTTIAPPQKTEEADNPTTLQMNYTSNGEMAVRCLRIILPKVRDIEFDTEKALQDLNKDINITLYPNTDLDSEVNAAVDGVYSDYDYVDSANTNDLYIFKKERMTVKVNTKEDAEATVSGAVINKNGTISAKLTLSEPLAKGDIVQMILNVNGEKCDRSAELIPEVPYIRMGKEYAGEHYSTGYIELEKDATLNVMTATDGAGKEKALVLRTNDNAADSDYKVTTSNENFVTVEDGVITAVEEGVAEITVASVKDADISFSFNVKVKPVTPPTPTGPETPVFTNTLSDVSYTVDDPDVAAMDGTATVSDGGTVTYLWEDGSGSTLSTSATYTPDVSSAATINVTLTATNTLDGQTKTATQSFTVTVS